MAQTIKIQLKCNCQNSKPIGEIQFKFNIQMKYVSLN
jgi:hypothetical protein